MVQALKTSPDIELSVVVPVFNERENLPELLRLRGDLAQWLPGEPLHGAIARAGLPRTLQPAEVSA